MKSFATTACFAALGLALLAITTAHAQQNSATTGRGNVTIQGTITDPTKALIPGILVRVKKSDIRLARAKVTNETGKYAVPSLAAGHYVVSAELTGFQTARKEIDVKGDEVRITVDFVMPIAPWIDTPGVGLSPAEPRARYYPELLVEQMWDLSLEKSSLQSRRGLISKFHDAGSGVVPALILALEDPDAQMRRNSIVVLMDLAGDSTASQSRVTIQQALLELTKALQDEDEVVRTLAAQAIAFIRR